MLGIEGGTGGGVDSAVRDDVVWNVATGGDDAGDIPGTGNPRQCGTAEAVVTNIAIGEQTRIEVAIT